MKQKLFILLTILSLSMLLGHQREEVVRTSDDLSAYCVDGYEHSFSQCDNFVDLLGRRGSTSSFSLSQTASKCATQRRAALDAVAGVKSAVADLYSTCGYSRSCDFPFEHQPQKELFFILRNIRI